jgi:hypothetical protein
MVRTFNQKAAELVECSFLIPLTRDSDKQPHLPTTWRRLRYALRTISPGGHSGPETVFRDVESIRGEWHDEAANTFDQQAIYLSVAGRVELVAPDPGGSARL